MNWPFIMQTLGWFSLAVMFGVSVGIIIASIAPQWGRILRLAMGRVEPAPFSPTASVLPLRTSVPPLRAVEAGAQPTDKAA